MSQRRRRSLICDNDENCFTTSKKSDFSRLNVSKCAFLISVLIFLNVTIASYGYENNQNSGTLILARLADGLLSTKNRINSVLEICETQYVLLQKTKTLLCCVIDLYGLLTRNYNIFNITTLQHFQGSYNDSGTTLAHSPRGGGRPPWYNVKQANSKMECTRQPEPDGPLVS